MSVRRGGWAHRPVPRAEPRPRSGRAEQAGHDEASGGVRGVSASRAEQATGSGASAPATRKRRRGPLAPGSRSARALRARYHPGTHSSPGAEKLAKFFAAGLLGAWSWPSFPAFVVPFKVRTFSPAASRIEISIGLFFASSSFGASFSQ